MKLKSADHFRATARSPLLSLLLTLVLVVPTITGGQRAADPALTNGGPSATAQIAQARSDASLPFEANLGQTDARVRYMARGNQYAVYLTDSGAVVSYEKGIAAQASASSGPDGVALHFGLVGGQQAAPVAEQPLAAKTNYFIGNDPSHWQSNVPNYGRVTYHNVYPGIDMAYYGTGGALEYDLVVAAGANPQAIRLSITGADALRLDGQDLVLQTALGEIRSKAPTVYQEGAGGREAVAGAYTLLSTHEIGFSLGKYDASRPLVIDPLIWSSYIGGDPDINPPRDEHGGDWGIDLTSDAAGNVYLGGTTDSYNFPTTVGAFQRTIHNFYVSFVAKVSTDGTTLIWSTLIGGTEDFVPPTTTAERNSVHGIALDAAGNVWTAGFSKSATYPTTANARQLTNSGGYDAVITALNPTGTALIYSTYLGGSSDDWGYSIALDPTNKVYVTGATNSDNFPTVQGSYHTTQYGGYDAFVSKLDPTLPAASQLIYSTYLGSTSGDMIARNPDLLYGNNPADSYYRSGGIKVDAAGNAYVTGYTTGTNFPVVNAYQAARAGRSDAFLSKLNPAGSALLYSTYLGTAGDTTGEVLVLDSANNAIIGGRTQGVPTTAGAYQTAFGGDTDGFVAKINTTLSGAASLLFSTYLGGPNEDVTFGLAVNSGGYIFVSGTASDGFPTTPGSVQPVNAGGPLDTFLAQLNPTATTLVYSTFLGGPEDDWGTGLALDGNDCAYVTGSTVPSVLPPQPQPPGSFGFPTTAGVFQRFPGQNNGGPGGGKMEGIIYKLCVPPTAAQVSNLAAAPAREGGVDVQWTSATELDHLGFNVLRAPTAKGPFAAVNAALIRKDTTSTGGGTYRFHDAGGSTANWYRIEAVDTHNTMQRFAVFAVGKTLPALPASPDPAQVTAEGASLAAANAKALAVAPHGPLTTTPYKLMVNRSGVTRVTYEQLQAAGVPLTGVDANRLRLTSGPATARAEVPLAMHLATPGKFVAGDSFDFIAAAAPSQSGDARAYYLDVANSSVARMRADGSADTHPPYATSFASTLHLEENRLYWQQAPDMGAPQPEGPWYWTAALDTYDGVATLQVPDVTAGAASLTLRFQGFTSDAAVLNDHHVQASLNGITLGDWRWSGRTPQQQTVTIPAGALLNGANALRLHVVGDSGAAHDGVYLVSADVQYTRLLRASANTLALSAAGGSAVAIPYLSNGAVLYDVTNPAAPVALATRMSGNTLFAQVPGAGTHQLLAAAPAGLIAATSINPVVSDNLRSGGADYVVIAADSLLTAGQQLAALHSADGLRTRVVPVSAIYDQFGTGAPDPAALAAFLTLSHRDWSPAPRYAALLGSASFDAHNYLNGANPDLLPTGYITTAYAGRAASDSSLALPQGRQATPGGILRPVLALGRLPARSPAEAAALIAKLQAYHTTTHTWTTAIGLVADAGDLGDFDRASEALSTHLGSTTVERVYESHYGSGTTTQILANLNSGRALLNYYGHGSLDQWSAGNIFNTNLVSQVNNTGHEAFVTAITCFNGDYSWGTTSLVTALVLKSSGGAIGGLSGTAISNPSGQHQLNEAFYSAVLRGVPVGEALREGYAATADPDVILQFQLIGDPALGLDVRR